MRFLLILLIACGSTPPVETTTTPPEAPPEVEQPRGFLAEGFTDAEVVPRTDGVAPGGPVFPSVRGGIYELAYTPAGDAVVALTTDRVVALIDARTGLLRAARRVAVRYDHSVWLGTFDHTGTRLLVMTSGYPVTDTYVWDLRSNEWHHISQLNGEQPSVAVFVGDKVVQTQEGGLRVTNPDGTTRTIELEVATDDPPDDNAERFVPLDDRTLLVQSGEELLFIDVETGGQRATAPAGDAVFVRSQGGLLAIQDGRDTRLLSANAETRGVLRGSHAHFSRDGLVVIDEVGGDARKIVDPRTAETVAEGTYRGSSGLLWGSDEFADRDDGRMLVRRNLVSGTDTTLLELWPEGEQAPFDEDTGVEPVVRAFALSPDGTQVAISRIDRVLFVDAQSGEAEASFSTGAGESSVWGVEPADDGFVVWGRGWTQRWRPEGLSTTRCPGDGQVVSLGSETGFMTPYQACVGDSQVGGNGSLIGLHGERFVDFANNQFQLRDFRTGRIRSRFRAPSNMEIYCEGNCSARYIPLSARSALVLSLADGSAWLVGSGRPRELGRSLGDVIASFRFGDAVALGGTELLAVYNTRGRKISEVPGSVFGADPEGGVVTTWHEGTLRVVASPGGTERMRAEVPEPRRLELRDNALIVTSEDGIGLWNVAAGREVSRVAPRTSYGLFQDGSHFVVCEAGRISVRRVTDGEMASQLGSCALADSLTLLEASVSEDGTFHGWVAVDAVTVVQVHPLAGGEPLVIRTSGGRSVASRGGKLWCEPSALEGLRFRDEGPLTEGAIVDARERHDPDLLKRFFETP
ncbi:MAG: hypothetical protein AAGE52_05740 [Myxococcota bacterium]